MNKLKMGMIGGGTGAFIGAVHRIAARLDGRIELIAGAFSSDSVKCQETGKQLGLADDRIYPSYENMLIEEAKLPKEKRINFVSIVTPNYLHAAPAILAIEKKIAVLVDKPFTHSLESAKAIHEAWKRNTVPVTLTYTYAGYPLILQARHMIANGYLGNLQKVYVEYLQGWLSQPLERLGNKQAAWRTDPSLSGKGGALGDIGCHAFHLAEFVTGQQVQQLGSFLETKVKGRQLDDDGIIWLQFKNQLSGTLTFSQIVTGAENNVRLKVVGDKGTLEWQHEKQNSLLFYPAKGPIQEFRAGSNYQYLEQAQQNCRTPGGHPEGYLEAFANQYKMFANQVSDWVNDGDWQKTSPDLPSIEDGLRGVRFIETAFAQNTSNKKWMHIIE